MFAGLAAVAPFSATADEGAWSALLEDGIVLFRHAIAPGGGDPSNFRLGDCSTQRNLDGAGRAQALRIGEAFRERNVVVGKVLSSQWCRSRETADIAFPGQADEEPAFNSFFGDRAKEPQQTAAALDILGGWTGPGALVVTTHQVNISALTGVSPASGQGIVIRIQDGEARVIGRIAP